mmetsp:Transcript_73264/g.158582  ORF Transcript_73264/g.158582 Transcript_73264/m.158582 type:complete len:214 (+) Transcript_73264:1364-2005(+)
MWQVHERREALRPLGSEPELVPAQAHAEGERDGRQADGSAAVLARRVVPEDPQELPGLDDGQGALPVRGPAPEARTHQRGVQRAWHGGHRAGGVPQPQGGGLQLHGPGGLRRTSADAEVRLGGGPEPVEGAAAGQLGLPADALPEHAENGDRREEARDDRGRLRRRRASVTGQEEHDARLSPLGPADPGGPQGDRRSGGWWVAPPRQGNRPPR